MSDHHLPDQRLSTSQSPFSSLPHGNSASASANSNQNPSGNNSNPNRRDSSQSHLQMQSQQQQQFNNGKANEFIPQTSEPIGENGLSNYRHEINSRGQLKGMFKNKY